MKILYRLLSLTALLLSTTPLAEAHMCDHIDELRALERARCEQDAQSLTLETEAVMQKIQKQIADYKASQPKPKTWYSKENGKNVLARVKNGTIAATLSYGLFLTLKKYAPHLPFTPMPASTGLLMPFLIGSFEDPQDRYSSLTAATLGLAYTTTAALPTKITTGILGSLISLWAGIAIYEKVKKQTALPAKEAIKN